MAIALHLQKKIRNIPYKATVLINFFIGSPLLIYHFCRLFGCQMKYGKQCFSGFRKHQCCQSDNSKAYNYYSCKEFDQPNECIDGEFFHVWFFHYNRICIFYAVFFSQLFLLCLSLYVLFARLGNWSESDHYFSRPFHFLKKPCFFDSCSFSLNFSFRSWLYWIYTKKVDRKRRKR